MEDTLKGEDLLYLENSLFDNNVGNESDDDNKKSDITDQAKKSDYN